MAQSRITRFESVTYKDKIPGSDAAQIPAVATIAIYKRGTMVKTGATINVSDPDPKIIEVWGIGGIWVGDQLSTTIPGPARLIVHSIPDSTHLEVSALVDTTLSSGTRLVDLTARPTFYSDPQGTTSLGSSLTSDGATGRAGAYIRDFGFDYFVSGTGLTTRAFYDARAGALPSTFANARDFGTLQAAVDSLSNGGVLFIPEGIYDSSGTSPVTYNPPIILPVGKVVSLIGAGPEATILRSTDSSVDLCMIQDSFQSVAGLTLEGSGTGGAGRGLVVGRQGAVLSHVQVRNVLVRNTSSWGLYVRGDIANNSDIAILCTYEQVAVVGSKMNGAVYIGGYCTTQYFRDCSFGSFVGYGAQVKGDGHVFTNCDFENGSRSKPFVSFEGANECTLDHCWFEDSLTGVLGSEYFVKTSVCNDINIDRSVFIRTEFQDVQAIYVAKWMHGLVINNISLRSKDPMNTSKQIFVEGRLPNTGDSETSNVVLIGGVARDGQGYHPVKLSSDAGVSGKIAQPGTIMVNQRGVQVPRVETPPTVDASDVGRIVYDLSSHKLKVVDDTGSWVDV
jgi:hypothetical protein